MKEKKCYDGYLVQNMDPIVFLMPYIMPRRTDSEVQVEMKMDLTKVEAFLKEQRANIPDLTLYHFIFAAIIRACATTPQINRFITGNRLYQRRHVRISMMVKKRLDINGKETSIFPTFEITDTLAEIAAKTNREAEEALAQLDGDSNSFDKLTGILYAVPPFVVRGFINFMMFLDRHGWLPKALVDMQPFHSGFFVTNVGSIGLPVIYHHLYEFGTTSGFLSIGQKEVHTTLNRKGEMQTTRLLPLKFNLDSRICDGFTYSCAFRTIRRCFEHPEWLLEPYTEEINNA